MRLKAHWLIASLVSATRLAQAETETAELPVCVEVKVQEPRAPAATPLPLPPPAPLLGPRASATSNDSTATPPDVPPPAPPPITLDTPLVPSPVAAQDLRARSGADLPLGQTPETYLARLMEHFVTHERGFVAVKGDCRQRITVELYPLKLGWTAFARYSGTGREERVDQLLPTELSHFAERSVLALLHDVSIHETVDRNNVLWADSLKASQTIHGRGHFVFGLGTRVRAGQLNSVPDSGNANANAEAKPALRLFTPMLVTAGYRGQFEEFGVDAAAELDIGGNQVAAKRNPAGGHTDYGGSAGLVLHAVRYTDVRGLSSFYYGGGATFALHWFSVVKPQGDRYNSSRVGLVSGGLDVDAVLGYEFMRASSVSFFLEGNLNVPAYAVRSENSAGRVNTWFPGAALKLGAIF